MSNSVILVSPGPVDGYPPVQYQSRLLADAGYGVILITTSLMPDQLEVSFAYPGVKVCSVSAEGCRFRRMQRFCGALWAARRSLPRDVIEIAYDPIGLWYSDIVPRRPRRRVAHLHELLQHMDQFLERRLKRTIHHYDAIVVPDAARANLTKSSLGIIETPLIVENYPLLANKPLPKATSTRFEVIYCGTLGLNQKLNAVIHGMPKWPQHANLVLIGNDSTPTAHQLRGLAKDIGVAERVHFLGWMDTPHAERRLAQANLGIALLDPGFEQWRTALGASNKRYQLMKAALPQIGDTNPGVPELLDGIGACVDAETHDPTDIAALVTSYATNPDRCAEEGARAFARHQETYNYERVFRRLQDRISGW